MEEARLWGEQGLLWKEDPALYPGAEGELAHLQAKGAAHSGVSPVVMLELGYFVVLTKYDSHVMVGVTLFLSQTKIIYKS